MAPDLDSITPALCMEGYLKKPKKWSKRYFVIREGPPPCLEYYDSHRRKSSGKPKKIIRLTDAWHIGKKVSAKQKYLIGICTEREHFCMAAESETSQTNWVNALRQAIMGYRGKLLVYNVRSTFSHDDIARFKPLPISSDNVQTSLRHICKRHL